jgi:hypothetical protein
MDFGAALADVESSAALRILSIESSERSDKEV